MQVLTTAPSPLPHRSGRPRLRHHRRQACKCSPRRPHLFPTGPAGLAFATTAAKRGHRVTLYEASDKIGGQFNLAKMVPGKVRGVPLVVTTDVKRHQLLTISDDLVRPLMKSDDA